MHDSTLRLASISTLEKQQEFKTVDAKWRRRAELLKVSVGLDIAASPHIRRPTRRRRQRPPFLTSDWS